MTRGRIVGVIIEKEEDEDFCCVAIFWLIWKCCVWGFKLITFLLCMRKMSRLVRVVLLWVYVLTFVLTLSLLLRFNMLNINKFQSAPTDMAPVQSHLNKAFCQSMTLNSTNPFTAYSFDERPRVDPNKVERLNHSYSSSTSSNDYAYWGFYLLEGSHMLVKTRDPEGSTMYVIKGNDNLQEWVDYGGYCSDCAIKVEEVEYTTFYQLTVTERDTYYLAYRSKYSSIDVRINVQLLRTVLDLSNSISNCSYRTGSPPCSFDLSLTEPQMIVYHNSNSSSLSEDNYMWSTCEPRWWLYLIFFGLLPVGVGVALTFAFWKLCKFCRVEEEVM